VAIISVKTDPPGAFVNLAGYVNAGESPTTISSYFFGAHSVNIKVEKPGYYSRSTSTDIEPGCDNQLYFELPKTKYRWALTCLGVSAVALVGGIWSADRLDILGNHGEATAVGLSSVSLSLFLDIVAINLFSTGSILGGGLESLERKPLKLPKMK
jgi:hypothetical protein